MFKRHTIKRGWICQVRIVPKGPITPIGTNRSLGFQGDGLVVQKRAKSAQMCKSAKRSQIQDSLTPAPGAFLGQRPTGQSLGLCQLGCPRAADAKHAGNLGSYPFVPGVFCT